MRRITILTALIVILSILYLGKRSSKYSLNTGDIAFVGLKTQGADSFKICALMEIPAHTKIHFTDSEWNGNRFGLDENNIVWISDSDAIPAGSIISFENVNIAPTVSHGKVNGIMKLSSTREAIFAYMGPEPRFATKFLAAVSNDSAAYGTLVNTQLLKHNAAIVLPEGTISARYLGPIIAQDPDFTKSQLKQSHLYALK